MKKTKTIAIHLAVLVLFFSFVSAATIVQETTGQNQGIEISFPKNPAFKQDEPLRMHFHLFNISSGEAIPPSKASCYLHLYNTSGYDWLSMNLTPDSNGLEFEVTLNKTFSSQIGTIPYIAVCNSSTIGGFLSSSYEVTPEGTLRGENTNAIPFMIYIFGSIAVLYWFGTMLQEDEWQQALKLLLNLFGLALLIIGAGYMLVNMQTMNVAASNYSVMNLLYWIIMIVLLFLIILFLVIFIFKLIDYIRKLKEPVF